MKIFYHDHFVLPLPEGHRFPMEKYAALRERIEADPEGLGRELTVGPRATDDELLTVHEPGYLDRVKVGGMTEREVRRLGFPWSPFLVERSRRSVGSTIAACQTALAEGTAVNLAGGTHHAFAAAGQGYCVFNDAAVAARVCQREEGVDRVLIFDCDVHQGNGTAAIFAGDESVTTVSIHGENNFPFEKARSDLDVPLAEGTGDAIYLAALQTTLDQAFRAASYGLVVYVSGADPYIHDRLGKLALSKTGLQERDERVLHYCEKSHTPVAVCMAGGYARKVSDIVDIHLQTVRSAGFLHERWSRFSRSPVPRGV